MHVISSRADIFIFAAIIMRRRIKSCDCRNRPSNVPRSSRQFVLQTLQRCVLILSGISKTNHVSTFDFSVIMMAATEGVADNTWCRVQTQYQPITRLNHSHMNHSNMNHGHMNHGHMNHGHMNHGHMNHGHMNHGHMNHGHMNHGHMNHGHMNHGHMNQGHIDYLQTAVGFVYN